LFSDAVSSGVISPASQSLLSGELGAVVIAGAAGRDLEDIHSTDVTLVTVLLDASSSIGARNLEQSVRDGYNQLLDALATSRERESLLVALWTFHDQATVVHAYVPVVEAAALDAATYRSAGSTRLYDTWCDALAANIAYAQQLREGGTPTKSIVVVITDGEDTSSQRSPADCARLARDLLASEQFVLAFVGVGSDVDFRAVARSMGVPSSCIEVQNNTNPAALRQTFRLVSQSAIRVSQSVIGAGTGFFH
jgi:uncharacterized protein YegL